MYSLSLSFCFSFVTYKSSHSSIPSLPPHPHPTHTFAADRLSLRMHRLFPWNQVRFSNQEQNQLSFLLDWSGIFFFFHSSSLLFSWLLENKRFSIHKQFTVLFPSVWLNTRGSRDPNSQINVLLFLTTMRK